MARHFWGGVEPLGDRGATPLGRGAAAAFRSNWLNFSKLSTDLRLCNKIFLVCIKIFLVCSAPTALGARGLQHL